MILYAEQPMEIVKGQTPDESPIDLEDKSNIWYMYYMIIMVSVCKNIQRITLLYLLQRE